MRDASHQDGLVVLPQRAEVYPLRQLADHLVEQVHGEVAVGLKVLHRQLPRLQGRQLGLQTGNVLDLGIQLGIFSGQKSISSLLRRDVVLEPGEDQAHDQTTHQGSAAHLGKKQLALALACRLAVREQIDEDHW